jgi:hypothetical protein
MGHIHVERFSQIKPETVRWLWKPYFPAGKLVLLDGDPGLGKSLVTLDLAARLSRGSEWPNGEPARERAATIFLNAEDSPADTVCPRAAAAGADLDRLLFVNRIDDRVPRLPDDVPALTELIRQQETALLVVDPIMAFLPPEIAANSDQCVRQALSALAHLADRTGVAIVLVRHLNKRSAAQAIYRGAGSTGIIGATRTGLLVAAHPLDPANRVLSVTKSNLCDRPPSLCFRIQADSAGRPTIEWLGPDSLTANQICRPETASARLSARDRAAVWLAQELANGPRLSSELYEAAANASIPDRTLERAKKLLKIETHRRTENGRQVTYWSDPSVPWPKNAPFREPYRLPPLEDL